MGQRNHESARMATAKPPAVRKQSRWRHLVRALFVFAVVPYLGILLLLVLLQRSLIYGPIRDDALNVRLCQIPGAHVEPVNLTTTGNLRLNGWHIRADTAADRGDDRSPSAHGRPLILYFCGNAANRGYRADEFEIFAELGADAICFDYRGYGDNVGSPSEAAFADDARAAWKYVTEERQIDPQRVVLFGESLGGAVATRLAQELSEAGTPPGGLVLRSTFTRLADVAAWHAPWLPVRWLLLDRYPSVERIGEVAVPILIFHGRRDAIVPFALGEQLFAAAPAKSSSGIPRRFIALETADHNDLLLAERDAFRRGMRDFLEQVNPLVARQADPRGKPMIAELVRKMTYFPDRVDDLSPGRLRLPAGRVHAITLTTDDALTLNGWHLLAEGHSAGDRAECDRELAAGRPLALFFSGNGGNRAYRIHEAGILTHAGADVFLFDYRGYGDNPGEPSEEALAADARAVWRYATQERAVSPQRIILYGESLGGAVATRLAAEVCGAESPPAGLIVRSTFATLGDVARYHYPMLPVKLLLTERYASVECISRVICPILMLHGEQDTIIPYLLGRKLFAAAPEMSRDGTPKQFVDLPHADHNDVIETEGDRIRDVVSKFMARVAARGD
ncbi:MAG: alpha/beta hydrolase [Deltaproteobacteria bacterium]